MVDLGQKGEHLFTFFILYSYLKSLIEIITNKYFQFALVMKVASYLGLNDMLVLIPFKFCKINSIEY